MTTIEIIIIISLNVLCFFEIAKATIFSMLEIIDIKTPIKPKYTNIIINSKAETNCSLPSARIYLYTELAKKHIKIKAITKKIVPIIHKILLALSLLAIFCSSKLVEFGACSISLLLKFSIRPFLIYKIINFFKVCQAGG